MCVYVCVNVSVSVSVSVSVCVCVAVRVLHAAGFLLGLEWLSSQIGPLG